MRSTGIIMPALLAVLTACGTTTHQPLCDMQGPVELIPAQVKQVRPGMAQSELENVLGQADYSPTAGVFYFSTGGDCPLAETERLVSCGLVADFLDYSNGDAVLTTSLQSCWWGGIAE